MITAVAFALTPEHDLASYGGTTHLRDGLHLNIGEALKEGDGTIVTDDPLVIRVLTDRQDLHSVDVPDGAKVTSHQLELTRREQHERDTSDVPEIALPQAVDLTRQHVELAAAQLRGDVPPDQGPVDPDEFKKDELVEAAGKQGVEVKSGDTKADIADRLAQPPGADKPAQPASQPGAATVPVDETRPAAPSTANPVPPSKQ